MQANIYWISFIKSLAAAKKIITKLQIYETLKTFIDIKLLFKAIEAPFKAKEDIFEFHVGSIGYNSNLHWCLRQRHRYDRVHETCGFLETNIGRFSTASTSMENVD